MVFCTGFRCMNFFYKMKKFTIFALLKKDSVAQPVEQLTLNQRVESSSLSGVTNENKSREVHSRLLYCRCFAYNKIN